MDKSRAYIRFVLPGFVVLAQWGIATFVIGELKFLNSKDGYEVIAKTIGFIIGSGAAGYLISVLSFAWINHIDYGPCNLSLFKANKLSVYGQCGCKLSYEDVKILDIEDHLIIANQIWFFVLVKTDL